MDSFLNWLTAIPLCSSAADYHHVSQQVKQLEEDTTVVLQEVTTAKSTMGRVLSAWDSYSDCLSSLQAWLVQGCGHRSEVLLTHKIMRNDILFSSWQENHTSKLSSSSCLFQSSITYKNVIMLSLPNYKDKTQPLRLFLPSAQFCNWKNIAQMSTKMSAKIYHKK